MVHKLSHGLQNPTYGLMPLEPTEHRPTDPIFRSRERCFSKAQSPKLTPTEYFSATSQPSEFCLSTLAGNHTIIHFPDDDNTIHNPA